MSRLTEEEQERYCAALPLLADLSAWRRAAGYDPDVDGAAGVRSTGESNARLAALKRRLDDLGVAYHWCPACAEYHLTLLPATDEASDE
jgi:hypothetical protein